MGWLIFLILLALTYWTYKGLASLGVHWAAIEVVIWVAVGTNHIWLIALSAGFGISTMNYSSLMEAAAYFTLIPVALMYIEGRNAALESAINGLLFLRRCVTKRDQYE